MLVPLLSPRSFIVKRQKYRIGALDLPKPSELLVLALVYAILHNPFKYLTKTLWLDEAWVAVIQKANLSDLLWLKSSNTIGLSALVYFSPLDQSYLRLITHATGYLMLVAILILCKKVFESGEYRHRHLDLPNTAIIATIVVGLNVHLLNRNDLKPYVFDGLIAVVIWIKTLEAPLVRRDSLLKVIFLSTFAYLFSYTALFCLVAVYSLIFFENMAMRRKRLLHDSLQLLIATLSTLTVHSLTTARFVNSSLENYWQPYFIGQNQLPWYEDWFRLFGEWDFFFRGEHNYLFLLLIASTIVVNMKLVSISFGLFTPALLLLVSLASFFGFYPLFDSRTSLFLAACISVSIIVAIVLLLGHLLASKSKAKYLFVPVHLVIVVVFLATPYLRNSLDNWSKDSIPNEEIDRQIDEVSSLVKVSDVLVVNAHGSFGFCVYWPEATCDFVPQPAFGTGFRVVTNTGYPGVFPENRDEKSISRAVVEVKALLSGSVDSNGYLVHQHMSRSESEIWSDMFVDQGLKISQLESGAWIVEIAG